MKVHSKKILKILLISFTSVAILIALIFTGRYFVNIYESAAPLDVSNQFLDDLIFKEYEKAYNLTSNTYRMSNSESTLKEFAEKNYISFYSYDDDKPQVKLINNRNMPESQIPLKHAEIKYYIAGKDKSFSIITIKLQKNFNYKWYVYDFDVFIEG